MKYDKLVRDKIPHLILSRGGKPITHIANDLEYWEKLKVKLLEEIKEFDENESAEELADILEVIDAIIEYKHFNKKQLDIIQKNKAMERGKFYERIILEES